MDPKVLRFQSTLTNTLNRHSVHHSNEHYPGPVIFDYHATSQILY